MDPTGAQVLNATAIQVPGVLEPVVSSLQNFFAITQWLVGGLFGLYLILVIMNWWQGRVKLELLRDIREDLDLLNLHFNVKGFKPREVEKLHEKRWEKIMQRLFEGQEQEDMAVEALSKKKPKKKTNARRSRKKSR